HVERHVEYGVLPDRVELAEPVMPHPFGFHGGYVVVQQVQGFGFADAVVVEIAPHADCQLALRATVRLEHQTLVPDELIAQAHDTSHAQICLMNATTAEPMAVRNSTAAVM